MMSTLKSNTRLDSGILNENTNNPIPGNMDDFRTAVQELYAYATREGELVVDLLLFLDQIYKPGTHHFNWQIETIFHSLPTELHNHVRVIAYNTQLMPDTRPADFIKGGRRTIWDYISQRDLP